MKLFSTTVLVLGLISTSAFARGQNRSQTRQPAPAPAPAASFYCIAFPSLHSVRVPALPGYGHGPMATSREAALQECQMRSPFGAGASCRISSCYPE